RPAGADGDVPGTGRTRPEATGLRDQRRGEHRRGPPPNAPDLRGRGPRLSGPDADHHPALQRRGHPPDHLDPAPDPRPRRQPRRDSTPVRARGTAGHPDARGPLRRRNPRGHAADIDPPRPTGRAGRHRARTGRSVTRTSETPYFPLDRRASIITTPTGEL